jgi:uncharacterized metal-binding protein YceD (DUF177 family)
MKSLAEFTIPFVGLKEGVHRFEFDVDKTFFEAFDYEDFNDIIGKVFLDLTKKNTLLELSFRSSVTVNVNCDLTNEIFDLPFSSEFQLVVKFGSEHNDDNEDLLILPHGAYQIDVSQYVYEMIVLAIPQKRVHPGVEDGTLKSDMLSKLLELQPKEVSTTPLGSDPRWDSLKKLINKKE